MQNIKYIAKLLLQRRTASLQRTMFYSESSLRKLKSAVSAEKYKNDKEFKELKDSMNVKARAALNKLRVCRVENFVKEFHWIKQMNLAEENESLALENLRTLEVQKERDIFSNELKNFNAFLNEKVQNLLRELQNRSFDIKEESRICDLVSDPFIDHSLPGLSSFKLALRWPWSLKMSKNAQDRDKLVGQWYIHAIFPDSHLKIHRFTFGKNSPEYEIMLEELHQTCEEFYEDVMMYWPDVQNPTSMPKCKIWITREWDKHGYEYGIPPRTFVIYTLALAHAFSFDFGITEGVVLTVGEAALQATEQMKKLVLFGEQIGADIPPEIACNINPLTNDAKDPKVIREIRPHFTRTLVNNRAEFRLVKPPIEISGNCNHKSNLVILPCSDV